MNSKKFIFTALATAMLLSLNAQKLMTRNGFVKFFSEAPLENIEAVNNQVSSIIDTKNGEFAFLVPIKGFTFEKALMQEHFNERYLESGKYPTGSFKGKIKNLDEIDFSKDGEYSTVFAGTMSIHGVEKEIEEKATIKVEDGKVSLHSVFSLEPEAYGVEIPASKRDNIAKSVEVTVKTDYEKKDA